ncbi:MAG: InlB B-repeat-containing protein, partial [Sphaerochaetaceae bacterium]
MKSSIRISFFVILGLVLLLLLTSCSEKLYITVSFNPNGGTPTPASLVVAVGFDNYPIPNNVTRTGYTLTGWFTTQDNSGVAVTGNTLVTTEENHTLYAHWTLAQYTIAYELDGGTNSIANPLSYTIESDTILLADPVKAGHSFEGWFSDAGFVTEVTSIPSGSTGNKTFYAKWSEIQYTITFDAQGGTVQTESKLVSPGETYGNLPVPTRTGYDFGGWYDGIGGTGALYTSDTTVVLTDDQTLYAKWTGITYTITYQLNGGENHADNPSSYTIADTPVVLKDPSRAGHSFNGWYTSSNFYSGTETTGVAANSTGNKTFYAKWTANIYQVSFDANGGDAVTTVIDVEFGKSYASKLGYNGTLPKSTKTGESFLGWWTDAACTQSKVTENTIVTIPSNHTLYAKHMPPTDGGWVFYDKGEITEGWRYLASSLVEAEKPLAWGPTGTDDQFYMFEYPYTQLGYGKEATDAIV